VQQVAQFVSGMRVAITDRVTMHPVFTLRKMIEFLTVYIGPHSIVSWCSAPVVYCECRNHSPHLNGSHVDI